MTVAGKFSTMSMADLVQWGRTAQRTGLLRLSDDGGREIQVLFRDGRIIFSSTNNRRGGWASYLRYLSLCTDDDIEDAFRQKEVTGASVASVLVHQRKLTAEQAISTLTEKTVEDMCDVFLWQEGTFQFEPTDKKLSTSLVLDLDPIYVVCEGIRRAELWTRMNAVIHPTSFFERMFDEPMDDSGIWEDARMARHLWKHLDGNLSVADLCDRVPFSRYKVYRGISELLDRHLARLSDTTAVVDREKRLQTKLNDARHAAEHNRWTEAMEILQGLAGANPGRADIVEELLAVTRGFERSVYEHNFTKDDVPVVTIGSESLSRLTIYPTEAFILSRIDGRLSVRDILRISPVSEFEGLRALKRLLSSKIVDFPQRKLQPSLELPTKRA